MNGASVENDGKTPLIKINTMCGPAVYFGPDFNLSIRELVKTMINKNLLLTSDKLHFQACNAQNVIYIDIDYHSNSADENTLLENNYEILKIISDAFINVNHIDNKIVNKFMFMPEKLILENGGYKCGGHCFIYLNENYNKNLRLQMYETTKNYLLSNNELINQIKSLGCEKIVENFDQIFDQGPIIGMNCLLPFAEKINAKRHYVLKNPEEINLDETLYINPVIHLLNNNQTDFDDLELELDDDIDIDIETPSKYEFSSKLATKTIKFIESLKYLSPYHKFWSLLENHNDRYKYVCKPLIDWLIFVEFVYKPFSIADGYNTLPKEFVKILTPLVQLTNKPGEKPNTLDGITKDIYSICMLKYRKTSNINHYHYLFNPKFGKLMKAFQNKTDKKIVEELSTLIEINGLPDKDLDIKETIKICYKLHGYGKQIFKRFIKFINMIMENITEEIRIFKSAPNSILENIREGLSFDEYFDNPQLFSQYNKIIKLWMIFSICESYYNLFDSVASIRNTLKRFTNHFVFLDNHRANPVLYIYNIRQTKTLQAYPYNQWICDNADLTIGWMLNLASLFIDHQLITQNRDKLINPFLNILNLLKVDTTVINPNIKPIINYKQEINHFTKDISFICSSKSNSEITPKFVMVTGDCPYFPMRNGILEFITKESVNRSDVLALGKKIGDYIFHYNNFKIYMDGYTNVEWHDDYNYNNEIYKKVEKTFDDIYPYYESDGDLQVCEYVKMMFAQTLHSIGSRDQIHQYYGSGGEGKSLINNALLAMLGSGKNIQINTINHKDVIMINPYGLSNTIQARGLISSNKTTHDSGGLVEAKNRRFLTLQEPDTKATPNMNVSIGKQLTSESTIGVREIYGKGESFQPKLYITIQTNQILGYSEDTDAVTRRYGVIFHRAKFVTSALRTKRLNSKYVHEADASLNDSFNRNPKYWEALFRLLLPYAQKFIRQNIQALSNVEKPKSLITLMDISKRGSSGLLGWLTNNIILKPGSLISLQAIINFILNVDKNMKTNGDGSIFDSSYGGACPLTTKENFIIETLNTKFGCANLYKLKEEIFKDPESGLYSSNGLINGENVCIGETITPEEKKLYFEEYSISNINVSIEPNGLLDKNSIYLIDYTFKK